MAKTRKTARPKTKAKSVSQTAGPGRIGRARGFLVRWIKRLILGYVTVLAAFIVIFAVLPVPLTPYIASEWVRTGTLHKDWVGIDDIAPVMVRAVVAAEDANFCAHWGLDLAAIKRAVAEGGDRGGSTISQQVVKNTFLWHGRSYLRKAIEAVMTPVVELVWTKRRILEVYLNVAEFGPSTFGIEAAAQEQFGKSASELTATQAGRLAAVLPSPKTRSAANPGPYVQRRGRQIVDGAETILQDGRAACFQKPD